MALARIITRSQACSRELALDLLARGYAVEIVTPDKVPDSIADLELRVDAGPGDQLIANVEAHDGKRTASLEFVHHLKAPMVPFMRRPPDAGETVRFSGESVSFNATPSVEDVELPAEAPQPPPRAVSPATDIVFKGDVFNGDLNSGIDPAESEHPVATQVLSAPPVEPPGYFAVEDPAVPQPTKVPPTQAVQPRDRFAGWPWGAALTFAGVVLLALVLGFGIRRTSIAAAQSSAASPVEKIAASSSGMNQLSAISAEAEKDPAQRPGQVSTVPSPPQALDSEGNSSSNTKEAQAAPIETPTPGPGISVSPKHGEDLIARDTVTYLDKRFEPVPKAKPAKPRLAAGTRTHATQDGGVIAANTVTYVNKPAPKAAK